MHEQGRKHDRSIFATCGELADCEAMTRQGSAACVHDAREVRIAALEVRIRGVLCRGAHLALGLGEGLRQLADRF